MINPATRPSNELNDFTCLLVTPYKKWCSYCKGGTDENVQHCPICNGTGEIEAEYGVRLRNGTIVRPVFKAAEDETCEDAFFAENYKYCWNLDGTSVTRSDYDMMEIVFAT